MKQRRKFIRDLITSMPAIAFSSFHVHRDFEKKIRKKVLKQDYQLELTSPVSFFDGRTCWVHPRAGVIPLAGYHGKSKIVMTMNSLDLTGSDVFKGMFGLYTNDLGKSWSTVEELSSLAPRYEVIAGERRPVAVSDFWPKFHRVSNTLLGIGHTVAYTKDWKVTNPRPRHTSYSYFDLKNQSWVSWKKLEMPDKDKFYNSGAGCVQRYDENDGHILLPITLHPRGKNSHISILRCLFDGKKLSYKEQGPEYGIDNETRGLHEPSLTKFQSQFFLTIRNDQMGYVSTSQDGLHFEPIKKWKFDDGTDLGNYNTQQHWVTHSNALYLVYTRRGANNDHVFRHRAPLFMAQVDPDQLCVIRETERILVPERGARLGNFGIVNVSPNETWVTVSEWMQPVGVEKYGSDGTVWIAKIKWKKKNKLFANGGLFGGE